MLNKIELIKKIESLPIYEFKEVFTKKDFTYDAFDLEDEEENLINQERFRAIVEKDGTEALSIVTNRYRLIQFKEILLPIIEGLGDLEGETKIYRGEGYTLIFPEKEEFNVKDGKLGLVIFNSVTKKYAVLIDFVVHYGNYYIILPKNVKAFKNRHIGNIKEIISNYENILIDVKEEWKTISNKFNKVINQEEYNFILKELKLGKRIEKRINEIYDNKEIHLWDFLIEVIKNIQEKNYKNEVNKMRKIKFISEIIFKFALIENINEN